MTSPPAPSPVPDALRVEYHLVARDAATARLRAELVAREQTVELPPGCVPAAVEAPVVGRVIDVAAVDAGRWQAVIDLPLPAIDAVDGADLPQVLNALWGNVSMWQGVRVEAVAWPATLLARFAGPTHGVVGLRRLCGVARRPLLCAALKPVGLAASELAELAGRLAEAGVDLVKDDHGLADQPAAPWGERVARCQDAVLTARARAGTRTVYAPNLTGPAERLASRLDTLRALEVRAALVAPMLLGLDTVRALAAAGDGAAPAPALLGHPALSGGFLGDEHGIAAEVLWGDLFRLAGCDAVIYPNAGGRFPIDLATCDRVAEHLRRPLGSLRPAFPALGGGIEPGRIGEWVARYGADTVFLVGAGIARQDDPPAAARALVEALEEALA